MKENYLKELFIDEAKAALNLRGGFGGDVTVEIQDNVLYLHKGVTT